MFIIRHPRSPSGASVPDTPSQMLFGYIEGDYTVKDTTFPGMYSIFNGDTDKTKVEGGSTSVVSPNEVGFDFSWQAPGGLKIEKVELWGSNDKGYITNVNPTDTRHTLYGWDGSWNAIGNTGDFTDLDTAQMKTITSTDQVTLFTKFKIITTYTGASASAFAALKIYEVGGGVLSFPILSTDTPVRTHALNGRGEQVVNGSGAALVTDSILSIASDASDYDIVIEFDKARPVDKIVAYGSSDKGYINTGDPTDTQIDLEGWNGSGWDALGDTGTFTDANSLSKTINSSDTTTLYPKIRIKISTATSSFRVCSDVQVHVFV